MSKITNVGSSSAAAVLDQPAAVSSPSPKSTEETSLPVAQQDSKDKVSDLKMEGQMREAQVRSQFGSGPSVPQFKMPGVDIKGPNMNDPSIQNGFKEFEKKMPSMDIKWPEKGEWKETKDKDGIVKRELTDAAGSTFSERVDKNGTLERVMETKEGDRRFELKNPDGYTMKGGADTKGNSWSVDSNGATTRMHTDAEGKMYSEVKAHGIKTREMLQPKGVHYKETLLADGKLEKEMTHPSGTRQFAARDNKNFFEGVSDSKGNSYSVDNNGTSTRMHTDDNGTMYIENSFKDGSRNRSILDKQGNQHTELKDPGGNITRTKEKLTQ